MFRPAERVLVASPPASPFRPTIDRRPPVSRTADPIPLPAVDLPREMRPPEPATRDEPPPVGSVVEMLQLDVDASLLHLASLDLRQEEIVSSSNKGDHCLEH